jgi:GTP cyclohydrolase IA
LPFHAVPAEQKEPGPVWIFSQQGIRTTSFFNLNDNAMADLVLNGHHAAHADTDMIGEHHVATAMDTPMHPQAFDLSDPEKIKRISGHFAEIMEILGLDLTDDSLSGTPQRVAKMYVQEIFRGLNPDNKPAMTTFDNKYQYRNLVIERNIPLQSTCEHHFQPIFGVAHVAYIPNGRVIGLSKLNRIVDFFARRPQVQERLTVQIADELKRILDTEDVAVYIDARHMCVQARGVEHHGASTITAEYSGKFLNEATKREFLLALGTRMPD